MTLPPYGPSEPSHGQRRYPQQPLTEQHVRPGRSKRPLLYAGIALALVLVVVAVVVTLRVLHDRGERTRDAYCAALRSATHNGSLAQGVAPGASDVPAVVDKLRDLAPAAVKSQWDDLVNTAASAGSQQPSIADAARLLTDVQAILADAKANCGVTIRF